MLVNVDGVDYDLNVDKAIASRALVPRVPVAYGSIVEYKDAMYLLAQIGPNHITAITLSYDAGNRWADGGVVVKNVKDISPKEICTLFFCQPGEYIVHKKTMNDVVQEVVL